ncbi:MAG TPA: thioredoxin domain-containing protein [Candidatus Sulfotelmatobacter sp.]|nr:thioredoxin domain-containing protein [Candidatus Sulfotelmatobacter sp.]
MKLAKDAGSWIVLVVSLLWLMLSCVMAAQETTAKSSRAKSVSTESGAINMPEGMTKDQGDAILTELKAIHQLLLNPQNAATPKPAPTAPVADKVQMKLASGWFSIGRDDAPVTMVEFTDYQCPFCRKYHIDTFAVLKKNYIDTGKVRFISRDLPLEFHPFSQKAAEAARCAGDQDKFWELRDRMIINSTDLSHDAVLRMAQSDSLDMTSFRACLDGDKYKAEVQKDAADAGALGISGTPSFVIGKSSKGLLDGDRVVGAVPLSVFDTEIHKFLPSNP